MSDETPARPLAPPSECPQVTPNWKDWYPEKYRIVQQQFTDGKGHVFNCEHLIAFYWSNLKHVHHNVEQFGWLMSYRNWSCLPDESDMT